MLEEINQNRRQFLTAAGLAAAEFGTLSSMHAQSGKRTPATRLREEGAFPSLSGATAWINSQPLSPSSLHGRVVLIDFCTYTCINWLRTLPYVRAWSDRYRDHGLMVIGVHTPEFEVEKNADNVRRALKAMRIDYPVAMDNDYAIWRAFKNKFWPALYLIGADGRIRYHYFGEGEYDTSDRVIRQLLAAAGKSSLPEGSVVVDARGAEVPADWDNLKSQENYVGYARTENFASPGGATADRRRVYSTPARLRLNQWGLSGDWTMGKGAITLNMAGGRIAYRFHARDLHLVMGPGPRGASTRFRVLIDGRAPGHAQGADSDEQGSGTVSESRLYQLIRQPKPIADRLFEIEFLDPGVEALAFTFG